MRIFLAILCLLVVAGLGGLFVLFQSYYKPLPGRDTSDLTAGAVPGHVEALKHTDAAIRKRAALSLWQIGEYAQEAAPRLLAVANDPDPEVREAVVKALGRTAKGNREAVPALITALKDPQAGVRAEAANSLAELWRADRAERAGAGSAGLHSQGHGSQASPPPQSGRPSLSPESEAQARSAVPSLNAALSDSDARVRAKAATALGMAGAVAEPAVPGLIKNLQSDPDAEARLQAVIALGGIGPGARDATAALVEVLRKAAAGGHRVSAAMSLGEIRSDAARVVPALAEAYVNDEDSDVRKWSSLAIGQFGTDAKLAVPVLEAALNDPKHKDDQALRQRVSVILERIREEGRKAAGVSAPPPSQGKK